MKLARKNGREKKRRLLIPVDLRLVVEGGDLAPSSGIHCLSIPPLTRDPRRKKAEGAPPESRHDRKRRLAKNGRLVLAPPFPFSLSCLFGQQLNEERRGEGREHVFLASSILGASMASWMGAPLLALPFFFSFFS